ncbi:MAG: hypothetical protein FWC50_01975 [Planctomycetaceae bacterium]|nr:hypothetical protein [Planctomycetaceae bacterium]
MTSLFIPQNILSNSATMIGQYSLKKTDNALGINIRNLSTGLRIHSGRDDPGGFVSSSILGTEISSLGQAVTNCKTADQVCSAADSALSEINNILIDIRRMVTEAANTGASNQEMLTALQLQVDASLDAIDRIANSTQFIDQKLIDGSLDFTTYGLDSSNVDSLQINQANFLGKIEKGIPVKILQQARQATLFYRQAGIPETLSLSVGGNKGFTSIPISQGASLDAIVQAVNLVSDSTGVAARLETQATNGSINLTSVGENNDIILTASKAGTLAGNFVVKYVAPREGNDTLKLNYTPGSGNNPNCIEIVLQTKPSVGNQPPEVLTTAEQVVKLINTSDQLKDIDGNGMVSACLPGCDSGMGIVTPFEDYAWCGSVDAGNALQFLGPKNSPDITFVASPGQALSVGYGVQPVYDRAKATVQGLDPGTSFSLTTKEKNADSANYDGYGVLFADSPDESVELDETRGVVVFNIDFSGRAADPARGAIDMQELQSMFENSKAGKVFTFLPQETFDPNDPPKLNNPEYQGINANMATVSGGLVNPGTLTVFLETDQNGNVKATANNLIDYFDHPASDGEIALIKKLGISVSNICNSSGCGTLRPTYNPDTCETGDGCPTIRFTSSGLDQKLSGASGTVDSKNGINASFTVTAKQVGSACNNTMVRVVNDPNGFNVKYDDRSKTLTIGIDSQNPPTANDVVNLINSDPATRELFTASHVAHSTGLGKAASGDQTMLTGGVRTVEIVPQTTITSSGGLNAVLTVKAKTLDASLVGCDVRAVYDPNGPSVSYDPASNQLAIGIAPNMPNNPPTAQQIVNMINSDETLGKMFIASIPASVPGSLTPPDGSGTLQIGDGGTLTPGAMTPGEIGNATGAPMLCASDAAATGIVFYSTDYGSDAFVDVKAILDQSFPLFDRFGNLNERANGTDIVATINNKPAVGKGLIASTNTTELDMSISINPNARDGDLVGFRITGGGALMQLGPDPDPTQQVRLGFHSMFTADIGGASGQLSELRLGGGKDLLTDTKAAYRIVEESILQVSSFRSRLGSFQNYEVSRSINQMSDLIQVATTTNSEIRDTDYAVESSNFAKNQLMLEATTKVLKSPSENMRMLIQLLSQ